MKQMKTNRAKEQLRIENLKNKTKLKEIRRVQLMVKKKVMVGMSGGVDSSVAAALLLEKGYDVVGITMQIWPDMGAEKKAAEGGCCSLSAVDDARRVSDKLGIPYYVLNFKDVFEEKVIGYFKKEYLKGRTPNPCIACNRYVKFEAPLFQPLQTSASPDEIFLPES
jgi:tRNA-specific 2-thiouridylase